MSADQMAVSAFFGSLNSLRAAARPVHASLEASKLKLTRAYTASKAIADPNKRANVQATLQPLIHQNSTLRLKFNELAAKFDQVVGSARATLQKAGYQVPDGLAIAPAVIVGVAVVALGATWAFFDYLKHQTDQHAALATKWSDWSIKTLEDPNATPAATKAASDIARAETKAMEKAAPSGNDPTGLGNALDKLLPIAALVAAAFIVPKVLELMPRGRRA